MNIHKNFNMLHACTNACLFSLQTHKHAFINKTQTRTFTHHVRKFRTTEPYFQETDALRLTVAFVPFLLPLWLWGHDILWFISFKDEPWKRARLRHEPVPFNYFLQKGIFWKGASLFWITFSELPIIFKLRAAINMVDSMFLINYQAPGNTGKLSEWLVPCFRMKKDEMLMDLCPLKICFLVVCVNASASTAFGSLLSQRNLQAYFKIPVHLMSLSDPLIWKFCAQAKL